MDPLFVRAVVFRKAERSIALVVYDLIGTLGKELNEKLAAEVKMKMGLDEVLFIATHTHSGPALRVTASSAYEQGLYAKTRQVLQEAWDNLEPVRLGAAFGSANLNYNRIEELPDGKAKMIWENPEKRSLGPGPRMIGAFALRESLHLPYGWSGTLPDIRQSAIL